ncbi:urease accessory protein UreF [Devosia sp.]|uniref:urease accessory protein UreF n=1 Tax=Devosia sp. TaxID=1871048 RepID=UPI0035B47904
MTTPQALQKLITWLSPAFPVGAFAWSAGLETAIADRRVTDSERLLNWIEGALSSGGIKTDAILLAAAWRAVRGIAPPASPLPTSPTRGEVPAGDLGTDQASDSLHTSLLAGEVGRGEATRAALSDLADLALALTAAHERRMETTITGDAFVRAAAFWPSESLARLPDPCPYPIAVGAIAAVHHIELADTLLAWLTATVHGQVSVAVRLVPLGQTDGLAVMVELEPAVAALAREAATSSLADIGGIAYAADIAQMRHETLATRIFRS